jgi:hypothetical protein
MKFNLLNFSKPDSLFNQGMRVSVYSEKKALNQGVGWHKAGYEIKYAPNSFRKENG